MESRNQTSEQGDGTNENAGHGDLLVLQHGYSYNGCLFIYNMSQYMIPLRELPRERGRYPSVREKIVSSAMRFFHYATRDTKHPSPTSQIIIKSLYPSMDLRCIAALCLAIAIDANRHNDNKINEQFYNMDTFNLVLENMWRKLVPVDPPQPPDTYHWRHFTIKIPEHSQNLAHAGEHLDSVLNQAFFIQTGINNANKNDIDRIRSIARAFINDWYFSPFSADPRRFDPKQTAVCAVYTARICLGGKLSICLPLLLSWNVKEADLTDWANQIFKFYEVTWNIVTGNNLRRRPGWISTKTDEVPIPSPRTMHVGNLPSSMLGEIPSAGEATVNAQVNEEDVGTTQDIT